MTIDASKLPVAGAGGDHALAERHMPILRLDAREPYVPLAMGYTICHAGAPSPSSSHYISPLGAITIEYAIWYDWDIQHLYDLEHVWVHLDGEGRVLAVEGSCHGRRLPMDLAGGLPELRDGRPVLYVEAGKHGHWADGASMAIATGAQLAAQCGVDVGREGVHLGNPFFEAGAYTVDALSDRLARRKMERDAFVPSFEFARSSDDRPPVLLPWADLVMWIPARVIHLMAELPQHVPHLGALFLDCGDTLVDETTEQKVDGTEVVLKAAEIPHAMAAVRKLAALGYPLVLVADGPRETFENLLKPRGIWDLMQGHVISGDIGELKPSPKMFAAAMEAAGLSEQDRGRVVMVGNNLARDIRGANEFGLKSLFVSWSKKRRHAPDGVVEMPDHRIASLDQLVPMIEAIERALPQEMIND